MDIRSAETHLFRRLTAARQSSSLHLGVLKTPGAPLEQVLAIGLDTNVLKRLRHDAIWAERMALALQLQSVALIIPGQVVNEYWNNHRVFAGEDWASFGNDFKRLAGKLDGISLRRQGDAIVEEIQILISGMSDELDSERSPDYLEKSRALMEVLLAASIKPMASRLRFSELASARSLSRTPPGFADEKSKSASHGDFYVWIDYLLGVILLDSPSDRPHCIWVTDDSKPDWKTGTDGHPALLEEFQYVTGHSLSIISSKDFRQQVEDVLVGDDGPRGARVD